MSSDGSATPVQPMAAEDCPRCMSTLELHQLDDQEPARLIGRCPECGHVFPVTGAADGTLARGRAIRWPRIKPAALSAAG